MNAFSLFLCGLSSALLLHVSALQSPAADPVSGKECRACHPSKLIGDILHGPIKKGECEPCHVSTGGNHQKQKGLFGPKAPGAKLCYQCHANLSQQKSVHGPIQKGDCSGCHAPHSSPYAGLLRGKGNDLCLQCHPAIIGAAKFSHKPVTSGKCLDCHVPHQSTEAKLVKTPTGGLCLSCHDTSIATGASVHKPVATRQCVACHEAHTADNKDLLQGDAMSSGKNATFCYRCHQNLAQEKSVHGPIRAGDCGGCHTPHNSSFSKLLRGEGSSFCYSCHKKEPFVKPFGHEPVKEGRCLDCHTPHQSKVANLIKPSGGLFCYECHDKNLGVGKSVHKPVATGECGSCHLVHSADSRYLLKPAPQATGGRAGSFCYNCHSNLAELKTVHKPVKEGNCTGCHVPHSSPAGKLLKSDGSALCYSCHNSATFSGWQYPHKPVAAGECVSCHEPHQSVSRKLLKGKELVCFECHDRNLATGVSVHKPVANGECGKCHAVHGGKERKLLLGPFTDKLHVPFELELYAFCFTCHDASGITGRKSTATGFRNGSVNLHEKHMRGHSCKVCHDLHASDQPKLLHSRLQSPDGFVYTTTFTSRPDGGSCSTNCHENKTYRR